MVGVAQLVRASDCGSEGRGFEPRYPPHKVENAQVADSNGEALSYGPLAQLAEQGTLNPKVVGSTPTRPTITLREDRFPAWGPGFLLPTWQFARGAGVPSTESVWRKRNGDPGEEARCSWRYRSCWLLALVGCGGAKSESATGSATGGAGTIVNTRRTTRPSPPAAPTRAARAADTRWRRAPGTRRPTSPPCSRSPGPSAPRAGPTAGTPPQERRAVRCTGSSAVSLRSDLPARMSHRLL